MNKQMFVYNAHAGDNTNFVYIPKKEQKANFVYKALSAMFLVSNKPYYDRKPTRTNR